jgi:hypothetical protein
MIYSPLKNVSDAIIMLRYISFSPTAWSISNKACEALGCLRLCIYVSNAIILHKHFCFQILHCGSNSGSTDHIELLMAIPAWFQPQALPEISGWWKAILSIIRYISSSTKPSAHNAEQQIYVFFCCPKLLSLQFWLLSHFAYSGWRTFDWARW